MLGGHVRPTLALPMPLHLNALEYDHVDDVGCRVVTQGSLLALASGGARSVVPLVYSVDSMGLSPPTSTPRCMAYAMTRTSRVIHARPHPTHLVARTSGAGLRLEDGRICSPGFDPLRVDLQGIRLDWTANTVGCVGLRGR
jgi:hypothetical protein